MRYGKNMSKGRDEYPTTVKSAYNLMLEWKPEPGSMQGGAIQHENHLAFTQHNEQGDSERTARIYKNIACYKCSQIGHYRGSCPYKEDEQEKLKDKGSSLDNIVQGVNCATTGISSMHVDHEADESNGEIEYNSNSDNEYGNDSDPTPGACFHQVSHHMNNNPGHLNPYWILLDNQSTVHMFSNHALLANI